MAEKLRMSLEHDREVVGLQRHCALPNDAGLVTARAQFQGKMAVIDEQLQRIRVVQMAQLHAAEEALRRAHIEFFAEHSYVDIDTWEDDIQKALTRVQDFKEQFARSGIHHYEDGHMSFTRGQSNETVKLKEGYLQDDWER